MGYKLAGFEVVGCCEIDPQILEMYKKNNHPRFPFRMDIRDFAELPDEKIPKELFDLDVLDGSPPCSVFSMAGKREKAWNTEKVFREGQAKQRLDDLFLYVLKVAKRLQPKVIIAENVKGLVLGQAKSWVNLIVKEFNNAGYDVQMFLLNSAKMGVPQKRERVFFVGRRKDLNLPKAVMNFTTKPVLFGDVREQNGKPINENTIVGSLLKLRIKTDRDVSDINKRVRNREGLYSAIINHDEEPAHTVTANGESYRFYDGLGMTDRDYINCQTFPQDYDFANQSVQYVCGMSVPPVMMAKIAEQVYLQWLK